jgi:hypothetical protein
MPACYAVRAYSHWQGASNPGPVIAVLRTEAEAALLADELSSCSFCGCGRGGYSVGTCYRVYRTTRLPAGYGLLDVDEAVLEEARIDLDDYAGVQTACDDD